MLEDGRFTVVVVERRVEAVDVITLELALPDGGELPEWSPGAHIDVETSAGEFRQYSLCGSRDDSRIYRIGVLLERGGRGGSAHLHAAAFVGTVLMISLPRNNFHLLQADSYVFVAGGIGITVLLPMIAAADASGAQWRLYYGGRARASMAFTGELAEYGERVSILPQDEHGLLPLAAIVQGVDRASAVYACGPPPLLDALEALECGGGWLHVERFTPRDLGIEPPSEAFDVRIASTGATIRVDTDQSIVDALEQSGISVVTSCREGTCASCETAVLGGEVLHRDSVLTDDERARGNSMMVCVSRAASGVLVLDL